MVEHSPQILASKEKKHTTRLAYASAQPDFYVGDTVCSYVTTELFGLGWDGVESGGWG